MATIHVATANGVHVFGADGTSDVTHHGASVTGLARAGASIWAIIDRRELWHDRAGERAHVTDLPIFEATCLASIDGELWVGTSEAHLFRVVDDEIHDMGAFEHVDGRSSWYTPWGGPPDTRSIAEWDDDVFVNVHVGGIPRTQDGGQTWTPTIDIDADVHQVTATADLVLAACADGLAVSPDRGATWTMRSDGTEARYARAVTVCGDAVLVSTANGPRGGRAAVYRGALSGGPFARCRAGAGWFDGNIDSHWLDALPDGTLAAFGTADGHLFASTDGGATWDELAADLPQVRRVLVMP